MSGDDQSQDTPDPLDRIAAGLDRVRPEGRFDPKDVRELVDLEIERRKGLIYDGRALSKVKRGLVRGIGRFLWAYSFASIVVLILEGFHFGGFDLPDDVLRLVVGSTFVAVFGGISTVVATIWKA